MKICRFGYKNSLYFGEVNGNIISPLLNFESCEFFDNHRQLTENIHINEAKLLVPTIPTKIVCVGRNYAEHAAELGNNLPEEPLLFLKAPSSLITDGENIILPPQSDQVEHEGELAIVIGRACKNLTITDNPLEYVLGFTCLNDVTARDIQRRDFQFTRGKSFDTFCPVGFIIETELDSSDIRIITRVNGEIKQDGRTSQMIFSVPFLIRYISNQMTLNAGDIIATGTPAGVSRLQPGDLCVVEIEGIGNLYNRVE